MLRSFAFAAALMGVFAQSAVALTCVAPTLSDSFDRADQSPSAYVVALGALHRTGENILNGPETGDPNMRVSYAFSAQFEGAFASSEGFDTNRSVPVTVEVSCRSAWCGGESLSDYGLYFLRRDNDGQYSLESGLCPMFFYDNPTEHQLSDIIGLMP